MKVLGQLEGAQLENLTAAPTPTSAGRMYFDTDTGKAWIYSNLTSTWKELQYVETVNTDFYDNGNSGKAITINWTNGNNQKVTLSDNCVISFSNPVAGETYTLQVKQANFDSIVSGSIAYKYVFNMTDQADRRVPGLPSTARAAYQPQGVLASTESGVHAWFYSSNIQPAYASYGDRYPNASQLPATQGTCVEVSPDGKMLVVGSATSPYAYYYPLTDKGFRFEYGVRPTPTAGVGAQTNSIRYSPAGDLIAYAHTSSPYVTMYATLNNLNTGGTYANPGTLPAGTAAYCVDFHPTGQWLAVASQGSPFLQVYPVSGSGFGTKLANPAALPAGIVYSCAFAPTGDYIAVGMATSPYLEVYVFTETGGGAIGGKVSAPSSLPPGAVNNTGTSARSICWRPQGDWIILTTTVSPYVYAVPFNRATASFGTPVTISPTYSAAYCAQFSPCGNFLHVGTSANPFIQTYQFDTVLGPTGSIITFVNGNAGQTVFDLVMHPSGDAVFVGVQNTPFMYGFSTPRVQRNYLRLNM